MLKSLRTNPVPPGAPPIERILWPFRMFLQTQATGGILLFACAVVALVWANSPWAASYDALWHMKVSVGFGPFELDKTLLHWINDGLMAVFFFVVGLEIKREVLAGELASPRKAALPIAAAVGGMLVPAAIYTAVTAGTPGVAGWGIPMATDIAFALGVLALLGDRVSASLKIFLTALAIVDDLGAVLVIALFYTAEISWGALAVGLACLVVLLAANRAGVRTPIVYAVVGLVVWMAFLKSGIHATIAGVLIAMTIPARSRIDTEEFAAKGESLLNAFRHYDDPDGDGHMTDEQHATVQELEDICEGIETPLHRLEHGLHPWVAFVIMPVFALANAGVALGSGLSDAVMSPVSIGVALGLLIGKPIGVLLASWIAVRFKVATLSEGLNWRCLSGASLLAGIGFTMSLFIAGLAFDDSALLTASKVGILGASTVAGIAGWLVLRGMTARQAHAEAAVVSSQ